MKKRQFRRARRAGRRVHHKADTIGLSREASVQQLASLFPSHHVYSAAAELLRQGSRVEHVYFIERGLVKFTCLEHSGEEVIVGLRHRGWVLGAASAILQQPYPVTAIALPQCHVGRISVEEFRHLLKTNDRLSWYVHQMHSREVYDWVAHVSGLASLSARQRLERLLWQLKQAEGLVEVRGERLQLPMTQAEMAQLIAVTPQYLCRLLKALEAEGHIERVKGWWRIFLPKGLE